MRDKLIELIMECSTYTPEYTEQARLHAEYLAQHLLNNNVIVLPIPYGTELHFLWSRERATKPQPPRVHSTNDWIFSVRDDGKMWLTSNDIPVGYYGEYLHQLGKTVFLTREEAEKALAERSNNDTRRSKAPS